MRPRYPQGFLLLALIAAILAPGPAGAQTTPPPIGDIVILDRPLSKWRRVPSMSGHILRTDVSNPGNGGFRLFFDRIKRGSVPFKLTVSGPQGLIEEVDGETFAAGDSFSTPLFTGSAITLEISAPQKPVGLDFTIRDLQFEVRGAQPFATVGALDWQAVASLPAEDPRRKVGRAVAKIVFRNAKGLDTACTGFMIGSDLLLTNSHCLGTQASCSSATAIFGYIRNSIGEQARCRNVVRTDQERDMALVRLDRPVGERWGTLTLGTAEPAPGRALYILQHPDGGPQMLSAAGCRGSRTALDGPFAGRTFSHLCDTQGGSSGSPVLDAATHEVVGLHYCCSPLPPDGENRAIPIDLIRQTLSRP